MGTGADPDVARHGPQRLRRADLMTLLGKVFVNHRIEIPVQDGPTHSVAEWADSSADDGGPKLAPWPSG